MRLYQSATSPFARKVMVVIHETGLQGIELAPVAGTPVAPGSMPVDRNPLGKIPALVLDDGRTIFDSRVICEYLDGLHSGRSAAIWTIAPVPGFTRRATGCGTR